MSLLICLFRLNRKSRGHSDWFRAQNRGGTRCEQRFDTSSHNPYKNISANLTCFPTFCFQPPLSDVQHEWLHGLVCWKRLALFVCAWVKVCEGACLCVWKTSPCCQDADPAITPFCQGSSVITVPSSPHAWLQFLLTNWILTTLSGCVYFQKMSKQLEISIYCPYRNL